MSLFAAVDAAFQTDGPLARSLRGFTPRAGQLTMAQAVAAVLQQGGELVVEAGTGVGKTFAYLVPVLLSGERVLLSTATKNLQDQLFNRDLPRLVSALGVPARTALLKGRGSYLCLHRLKLARQASPLDKGLAAVLSAVERWALQTRTGDLAEVSNLPERSPIWPLVTSTRENCLGSQCPDFRACHVNLARREALAADVVVINHHLFFADLQVRESGMAELLPTVRAVVFDEAHQINETGVQFLGVQLGTAQLLDFARDMLGAGLQHARGLVDWTALVSAVDTSTRDWRLLAGRPRGGGSRPGGRSDGGQARLAWEGDAPQGIHPDDWTLALGDLALALAQAAQGLDTVSELAPDFVRLRERCGQLHGLVQSFIAPCEAGSVRWLDLGTQMRMVESPLDIAQAMRDRVLKATPITDQSLGASDDPTAQPEAPQRGRAWVFTSATLGDDSGLQWFTEPCGLSNAVQLRVDSPFDYARQSAVHVPRHLPKPGEPGHTEAVADWLVGPVQRLGGRTLVLTTTLRALSQLGELLGRALVDSGLEVLVQGQGTKSSLIQRFEAAGRTQDGMTRGAVLVASASFWEGVDIPGDALQMVVIDKLPFPPPSDPLVQARTQRLEAEGRKAFSDYFLPEAAVALKQGAGRLIRSERDQGVLVVCDTRLVHMAYGRKLLAGLPPMRRLDTDQAFEACLEALTKTSTTGHHDL